MTTVYYIHTYRHTHTYRCTNIRRHIHMHTHTGFFKMKLLKRHGTPWERFHRLAQNYPILIQLLPRGVGLTLERSPHKSSQERWLQSSQPTLGTPPAHKTQQEGLHWLPPYLPIWDLLHNLPSAVCEPTSYMDMPQYSISHSCLRIISTCHSLQSKIKLCN